MSASGADLGSLGLVTTKNLRRAARYGALSAAVSVLLIASPASADVTEGWSNPDPVDTGHAVMLYVVYPLAIVIGMIVLGLLPKLIKRQPILDQPVPGNATWIGAPSTNAASLNNPEATEGTGGASGTF